MDLNNLPIVERQKSCPLNLSRLAGRSQLGSVTIYRPSRRVSDWSQLAIKFPRDIGARKLVYPGLVCTSPERLVTKCRLFCPPAPPLFITKLLSRQPQEKNRKGAGSHSCSTSMVYLAVRSPTTPLHGMLRKGATWLLTLCLCVSVCSGW